MHFHTNPAHEIFLSELRLLLESIEDEILAGGFPPASSGAPGLLRNLHTLEGSLGVKGWADLAAMAHRLRQLASNGAENSAPSGFLEEPLQELKEHLAGRL